MDRRAIYITILLSMLLHTGVLYYVAVTWGITSIALEEPEQPVLAVAPPPPPPPPPPPVIEPIMIERPRFRPRAVLPPPVRVRVPPAPLKPQPPAKSTADATQIVSEKRVIETPALSDKQITDHPVSKPPGKYPQRALDAEKEGTVLLRITIQSDGMVSDAAIVSAKPPGWFESAAIATVKRWRYKAAGRVITANVEVTYKLE